MNNRPSPSPSAPGRRTPPPHRTFLGDSRGVAFVGVVFGFLVLASLTLAVLNMSATSQLQVVSTNMALKAYYLAESGFRIAAGYYLNTGDLNNDNIIDDDKADVLRNYLDSRTFDIAGAGSVTLAVHPYWMLSTDGSGTSRVARFPGQVPQGMTIPDAGTLFFMDSTDPSNNYSFDYTSGSLNPGTGVFSYVVASSVPSFPAMGESLYFCLNPAASNATISHGSDLLLTLPSGYTSGLFPRHQGIVQVSSFSLEPEQYIYSRSEYDATNNRLTLSGLTKISDPDNDDAWTETLQQSDTVIFKKFLVLESLGQAGEEQRMLRFHTPVQDSKPLPPDVNVLPETRQQWLQTFAPSDVPDWQVGTLTTSGGGTTVYAYMENISETTGSSGSGGNPYRGGHFWYKDRSKVNNFWKLGGYRLAYDVQTKPGTGVRLPNVATGISFRARGDQNNPDTYLAASFMQYSLPTFYFRFGRQIGSPARDIQPGDSVSAWYWSGSEWISRNRSWKVQGKPVVASGSYSDNDARGTLRLTEPSGSGSFSDWDWLAVEVSPGSYYLFARGEEFVGATNDFIPDAIKPIPTDFSPPRYDIGRLLLVLWEKSGNNWRWLAYKDLSHDQYLAGLQDWPSGGSQHVSGGYPFGNCTSSCAGADGQIINDNTCLMLRVREKSDILDGSLQKFNEINVYYGDSSSRWTANRPGNSISYDIMTGRKRYEPGSHSGVTYFPTWPPQRLAFWNQGVDFFSHVEEPNISGGAQFQWDAVNPAVSDVHLDYLNDGTIRTTALTTPSYDPLGTNEYLHNEVGMHAFGTINGQTNWFAGFADFALRFVFDNAQLYGGFLEAFVQ